MSKKDLSLEPHKMRVKRSWADDFWFYEEANGLCVVSENGQATIPLRAIRAYLKRLDK